MSGLPGARPWPRVVAIGGGHGLAQALRALRWIDLAPTAVVTVADDGGSSGRLRRDLGIIAPGDLRMALLALAQDADLAEALSHRFGDGELAGHALGNLVLVALAEQDGGFLPALARAGRMLACRGRVLPSTTEPVELHAEAAGSHLDGQAEVTKAPARIEKLWLVPSDPPGCAEAVAAIEAADAVVLGPGSLYTSIVVNLLVGDIRRAVERTPARLVHIANVRTQRGETSGLDLDGHLGALLEHLGGRGLDATILHDGPTREVEGTTLLGTEVGIDGAGELVLADVVGRGRERGGSGLHDPAKLGGVLHRVMAGWTRAA